ncbi:MAG TPA: DsbA family protein [Anaeromyxobacteraceae bacterium]|nr:DsbA family protein [Anaeromyxobacteraceae bacterium]
MRTAAAPLALALLLAGCGGEPPTPAAFMRVPLGDSPQRGPSDAWVTIVEFSDFQCPYCGSAAPVLNQVLALYPADARLVYKHFPLRQHANARPAANAAECARAQDPAPGVHFWAMHDLLFANQAALDAASLAGYAGQIAGLDATAWQVCFDARQFDSRVQADLDLGASMGVGGTPTFAINGRPLVGAQPLATFTAAVEAARAAAIASGIPRAEYYDRAVLGH